MPSSPPQPVAASEGIVKKSRHINGCSQYRAGLARRGDIRGVDSDPLGRQQLLDGENAGAFHLKEYIQWQHGSIYSIRLVTDLVEDRVVGGIYLISAIDITTAQKRVTPFRD